MIANKVFTNEKGRYDIRISLITASYETCFTWSITVLFCPKGKRIFKHLQCTDDWEYRKLSIPEREKYYNKFILSHIEKDWIEEVQSVILNELKKPII